MGRSVRALSLVLTAIVAAVVAPQSMGAHIALIDGYLIYTADAGEANDLTVHATRNPDSDLWEITFTDLGALIDPGPCVSTPSGAVTCTQDGVWGRVQLGDLNDRYAGVGARSLRVDGGAGDDVLTGGADDDSLYGGPGDDRLDGGANWDYLSGQGGDDRLIGGTGWDYFRGGEGSDRMQGGSGLDRVTYDDRRAPVRVTLDARADDGRAGEGDKVNPDVEGVTGGAGADILIGNRLQNDISGLDGDDFIWGRAASDVLDGGRGADDLVGGAGDDYLTAQASDRHGDGLPDQPDRLRGGFGNDLLDSFNWRADEIVDGGHGRDRAFVDARIDPVRSVERVRAFDLASRVR